MENTTLQVADPEVSKEKFNLEISGFLQSYPLYRKKGVLLLHYSFPQVKIAFLATKINPSPLIFAVRIDFTNYDLEPPSIQFIDVFSDLPVNIDQLPHQFPRRLLPVGNQLSFQPLVLAQSDKIPFLCIPGVREYHNHPAHTGDSWLLHRGIGGEGTLGFLIEKLFEFGISGINGLQVQLAYQKLTVSFDIQSIPQ